MSRTITITEALGELKLISKQIQSNLDNALKYVCRPSNMLDPLATKGGSQNFVTSKAMSTDSLLKNQLKLRSAINEANRNTNMEICGVTRNVSEWLSWRREIAPTEQLFYQKLVEKAANERVQLGRQKVAEGSDPINLVVHFDEIAMSKKLDELTTILGTIDQKLSIHNATTEVTVY